MTEAGYDAGEIARVRELLQKRRLNRDPEVQLLEDVACVVFLENDLVAFAAKHPEDKLIDVLQKTWAKMTPRGHRAALELVPTLPPEVGAVVGRALAGEGDDA